MLVLTRKTLESVVVGGRDTLHPLLTITVLEIAGGKVRLGFVADGAVPIHRWEVWQRIHSTAPPDVPAPGPAPDAG